MLTSGVASAFLQNSVGVIAGPFDSFLVVRSLKTLALRMGARNADTHKAQKKTLETQIASEEARIDLLRRKGYTEGQLVEYNDKLNRYRQELHDLKQPMP